MCSSELTTNTATAETRIGSQRENSGTMAASSRWGVRVGGLRMRTEFVPVP